MPAHPPQERTNVKRLSRFNAGITINVAEVDFLTGALLVGFFATLIAAVVDAGIGNNGFWFFTQAQLLWTSGILAAVLVVVNGFVAAFQNLGIGANSGVLTKVEHTLSLYIGYFAVAVAWVASLWTQIQAGVSALGVSPSTTAVIGAMIAAAVIVSTALQKALQNLGITKAITNVKAERLAARRAARAEKAR